VHRSYSRLLWSTWYLVLSRNEKIKGRVGPGWMNSKFGTMRGSTSWWPQGLAGPLYLCALVGREESNGNHTERLLRQLMPRKPLAKMWGMVTPYG
jgi:hypothetical protein